MPNYEREY
jgi:hypothetical protein